MYDNDVEWLFSQVPTNTTVIITTSGKSFDSIAVAYGLIGLGNNNNGSTPGPSTGTILKKGSRGSEVQILQRKLTSLGYSTKGVDGIFGANTDQAVRQFQKARHLAVDGVVGPATKKALGI
jgi:peptidoglycan hydrolase-like protein with peptidoglycan-binding domain